MQLKGAFRFALDKLATKIIRVNVAGNKKIIIVITITEMTTPNSSPH
jgi:hypothetical protein